MKSFFFLAYKLFLVPHIILYKISDNRHIIDKDLKRWSIAKKISKTNIGLLLHFLTHSKDFRTIFYFRIDNILKYFLNFYCRKDSSFKIDINTNLEGGILTGHPYCTILNAHSIGTNFYVNHLVTIGEINGKKPTIGKNVSIYTGAIVIGDIAIGDNVIIGAGAVVVKDVPSNCTVVGNPARIVNNTKKII